MDCPYKDLCNSYIIKEQHKLNVQRKQLLGEKKNLLYYIKSIKYPKQIVTKPDCDSMCWVKLEITRDLKKNNKYRTN